MTTSPLVHGHHYALVEAEGLAPPDTESARCRAGDPPEQSGKVLYSGAGGHGSPVHHANAASRHRID